MTKVLVSNIRKMFFFNGEIIVCTLCSFQTSTFTKSPVKAVDLPSSSRTTTTTTTRTDVSPHRSYVREISKEDGSIKEKETVDKEVIEKKTTIEDSPVREGNKETYRKTTITEKEEKIHKTQVRIISCAPHFLTHLGSFYVPHFVFLAFFSTSALRRPTTPPVLRSASRALLSDSMNHLTLQMRGTSL